MQIGNDPGRRFGHDGTGLRPCPPGLSAATPPDLVHARQNRRILRITLPSDLASLTWKGSAMAVSSNAPLTRGARFGGSAA